MLMLLFHCLFYSFSFEDELQTTHLPEMVFGESSLSLQLLQTGIKLHFNALDALKGWKKEALPPVEVPAAAKWKFRRFSTSLQLNRFFFSISSSKHFLVKHVGLA
jgi:hypothetical protein